MKRLNLVLKEYEIKIWYSRYYHTFISICFRTHDAKGNEKQQELGYSKTLENYTGERTELEYATH